MAAPDMSGMSAMADHWVKMQKLPPKEAIKGCPNFRRIPGYKVNFNFYFIPISSLSPSSSSSSSIHLLNLLFEGSGPRPYFHQHFHPLLSTSPHPLLLICVLFLIFILRSTAAASPPLMASRMSLTKCAATSTPRTARSSG